MSFGFGVGDFITVVRLAAQIRKDFSGAPVQFQLIASEVKSLTLVLQDIDVFLAGHDVDADQGAFLRDSERSCTDVLSDIEKIVSRFSSLGNEGHGFKLRTKRIWHRLKWEPDEVRDLRARLTAILVTLNTFWEAVNRNSIVKILDRQDKQQNQEMLNWLSEPDYISQHHEHLQARLPGTGEWLLNSVQFTEWVKTKGDYLYLHGIPGGGKSTLVSMIIENLQNSSERQADVGICYYYSAFGRGQDHKPERVLMCLLRQLGQSLPKIPSCLETLYSKHTPGLTLPSLEELDQAFKDVTEHMPMVYIVIDALDEFDNTNLHRATLINEILELRKRLNANILLTSRSIPLIMNEISGMEALTIRADDHDVKLYIRHHLHDLPNFVTGLPDLQSEIENAIANAADGMFLLAKLHLDALRYKRSPRELRKALPVPGRVESAYANAYKKTISVISSQHPDQRDLAMDALGLIVFAKQHLKSTELLHALALETDEHEFHFDNVPDLQDVISASCGLIVFESSSNLVHLVHKTAQDFLAISPWLKEARMRMGRTCISYLLLDEFASGPCLTTVALLRRLTDYRFYSYASCFWSEHVSSPEDDLLVRNFLENRQHVQATYQILAHRRRGGHWHSPIQFGPGFAGSHLAAALGLSMIIATELEKGDVIDDDGIGRGILSYAAEAGHEPIVRMLIAKGIEADLPDVNGRTPLSYAAEYGHERIVVILLEHGSQGDHADALKKTPLSYAAKRGNTNVVSVLLQHKTLCDTFDTNMRTPLMHASYSGHPAVVDILLAHNAAVDERNADGQSALCECAARGHNDIATLLLAYGADVNFQDANGCTPLFLAAAAGRINMVTMLLRASAQIELANFSQQTPLACAAEMGDKDIVSLLFTHGAQLNCRNNNNETPLYHAVNNEDYDVAIYLLEHGADPTIANKYGWTALHLAATNGDMEILKVLLESEQRGDARASPEIASSARVLANDSHGVSPATACESTTTRGPRRYGTKSNRIYSRLDAEGRSALHLAAACGKLEATQYLIKSGSDSSLRDKRGKGLLDHACSSGSSTTVTAVLENFELSQINQESFKGWSALHWACLRGDLETIKKVMHAGVKFSSVITNEPEAEWSPLDVAIYYCNTNLISSEDGGLIEQHNWIDLIGAGLVEFDENSEKVLPIRRNELTQAIKMFYGCCDGCLQEIRGHRFRCRQCREFDYCFMCKHDSHLTHPGHDWILENPEELANNPVIRPQSNITLMNVVSQSRRKAAQSWS